MHYILFYKTIHGYIEKRAPYREEHPNLAQAASDNGSLIMAGALADPADGAVLVFKGDARGRRGFRAERPLCENGLIADWHVRAWTMVTE